jgi:hypothetical protein
MIPASRDLNKLGIFLFSQKRLRQIFCSLNMDVKACRTSCRKMVWDAFDVQTVFSLFCVKQVSPILSGSFLHTWNIDGQHIYDQKPYLGVPCVWLCCPKPKPEERTLCVGLPVWWLRILIAWELGSCLAFCFDEKS